MKKVFTILFITAVLVLMFSFVFTKIVNDSSSSGTNQIEQKSKIRESSSPQQELVDFADRTGSEQKDPAEVAKQIMDDISDAKVEESTEDLRITFDRLEKICERAVETCDAMLAAKYNNEQEHVAHDTKGAENGND